jgi:hypothetical protein
MRVSLWKKRISLIFATFVNPWGATKSLSGEHFLALL